MMSMITWKDFSINVKQLKVWKWEYIFAFSWFFVNTFWKNEKAIMVPAYGSDPVFGEGIRREWREKEV